MPPKYPCGTCDIGVRFSGIKCTGQCQKWYHAGCQNILEKNLKKWGADEIDLWKCTLCRGNQQLCPTVEINDSTSSNCDILSSPIQGLGSSNIQNSSPDILNSSLVDFKLEKMKTKLQDHGKLEEQDLETSLTLAAEAGSFLLQENIDLKRNNNNLNCQVTVLKTNLLCMEAKIEELTTRENKYEQKIETLLSQMEELEQQLSKSKQDKIDVQTIFEEHDIKQSEILTNYSLKINEQEKLIAKLKHSAEKSHTNVIKTSVDVGTQTIHINSPPTNVTLLLDLDLIKEKQDQMVQSITELNRNLKNIAITIPLMTEDPGSKTSLTGDSSLSTTPKPTELTGGISQTPTKKLSTTAQTRIFNLSTTPQATESTGGISQTPTKKLSITALTRSSSLLTTPQATELTGGISQTPTKKLSIIASDDEFDKHDTGRDRQTPTNKLDEVETGKDRQSLSLSLNHQPKNPIPSDNKAYKIPERGSVLSKTPPMNTFKRLQNESHEEFFIKHIDFYKDLITNWRESCTTLKPTLLQGDLANSSEFNETTPLVEKSSFLDKTHPILKRFKTKFYKRKTIGFQVAKLSPCYIRT
ncbi:hypothetical protein J6590_108705 [Homalodisca vitripennis]|nr:hypothetical protein J6590_108705 [Homalodisca vitripennis]